MLKTSVQSFPIIFRSLLPVIEVVFHRMCDLHYRHHRDEGWDRYWKGVSREGYDIIRGHILDYGNMEYTVLYKCICAWSPPCNELMLWLAQYFPSLHPTLCNETEHSISMKGDVVEICMAALRGHPDFEGALSSFGMQLPTLFNRMNQLSRTVQYIDAFLRTGRLKFQDVCVQRLPFLLPHVGNHTFVMEWMQDDTRHLALCSLV